MPIIKSNKIVSGLQGVSYQDDKVILHHASNISGALAMAQGERDSLSDGWTKDRNMRKIATVPESEFILNPHLLKDNSTKVWRKFLQNEGRDYAVVDPKTI